MTTLAQQARVQKVVQEGSDENLDTPAMIKKARLPNSDAEFDQLIALSKNGPGPRENQGLKDPKIGRISF